MKKVSGIYFFVIAALALAGSVFNGSLFGDKGSAAGTYGSLVGILLFIVAYVGSGILFFLLDKRLSTADGIRSKRKLNVLAILLLVIHSLILLFVAFSAGIIIARTGSLITGILFAVFPLIGTIISAVSYEAFFLPMNTANSTFDMAELDDLTAGSFTPIAGSSDIHTNGKVILFKKLLVLFPTDAVAEVKNKQIKLFGLVLESNIIIKFKNGRKATLISGEYEALNNFLNAA